MAQKPRDDKELKRLSAVELSGVVGIGATTVQKWRAAYSSFPPKDKNDLHCIRDVVVWWLCNKAPDSLMEEVWLKLGAALGRSESQSTGMPVVNGASKDEFDRHKRMMELRLDDAKLRQKLGQLVDVDAVRDVMLGFAKILRDRELVLEKKTGEPVVGVLDPAFDWLAERLAAMGAGALALEEEE